MKLVFVWLGKTFKKDSWGKLPKLALKVTFFIFLSKASLCGQTIKGIVFDSASSKPLENVHIYLLGSATGTVSDANGQFQLHLDKKATTDQHLQFSMLGFREKTLSMKETLTIPDTIYMHPWPKGLDEVVLTEKPILVSKVPYRQLSPMKQGVFSFGASIIRDKLFVVGGEISFVQKNRIRPFTTEKDLPEPSFRESLDAKIPTFSAKGQNGLVQVYDFQLERWTLLDMELDRKSGHNVVSHGEKLYIIGGKTISPNGRFEYLNPYIDIIDLTAGSRMTDSINPHQAVDATTVSYGKFMMIMGGSIKKNKKDIKQFTDKVHLFDMETGYWYELPSLICPKETQCELVGESLFCIGGSNGKDLSTIDIFDLQEQSWSTMGSLFEALDHVLLATDKKKIYVYSPGKLLVFDLKERMLVEYALDLDLKMGKLLHHNGQLYLVGGLETRDYSIVPSNKMYRINLLDLSRVKKKQTKFIE